MNEKKIILILFLTILFAQVQAQNITNEEKDDVLQSVIQKIENIYPFPEISKKTTIGLKSQISEEFYNKNQTPNSFATQVTNSLEKFSNDKHLDLIYNPKLAKALLEETESDDLAYTKEEAEMEIWNNYGFKELSILDGNIGYLNLSVFFATDYAGKTADVAMSYFSNCNALIIDLRQNGGGWDDMVNYLLGYFIDNHEPLLRGISQSTLDSTYYSATIPNYVSGKKLTDIPLYVLTSAATASAAEGFASHLKYFNEYTTIIGSKTRGAENPVTHLAINEHFVLQLPVWKKIYSSNPKVWEGVGILPDIESNKAKRTAHLKALEKLIKTATNKTAIDKYQWALDGLIASYENIDTKNINRYVGDYDKIKIIYKDGKLYYQNKERPVNKLIPISENYFVVEGVDYFRLKFIESKRTIVLKQIFTFGIEREYLKNE